MLKKIVIIISVVLLLSGCEGFSLKHSEPAVKPVHIKKKEKPLEQFVRGDVSIVGVGDSLTAGVGDDQKKGYVGYVQQKLMTDEKLKNVTVSNYAVLGYQTDDLIKRLNRPEVETAVKGADIIMLTIGGNDVMKVVKNNFLNLTFEPFRKEQVQYEKKLKGILQTIRERNPHARIVFVGLYNPFKYAFPQLSEIDVIINEWNKGAMNLIDSDSNADFVPIADLYSSGNDKEILYKDAFHPNEKGYSLIGQRVFDKLTKPELTKPDLEESQIIR